MNEPLFTDFRPLARDIARSISRAINTNWPLAGQRTWHHREQCDSPMHPLVLQVLSKYRAHDMHQLVLEWPHVSSDDAAQLAYTRDDAKGVADVQTRTPLGKYLRRHFPRLQDHTLRDYVALYTASLVSECRFTANDVSEYVRVVQVGPQSCMKWALDEWPHKLSDGEDPAEWHPYRVYTPELGWRMAVRTKGAAVVARALVYETAHCKYFVRSFRALDDNPSSGGYSHADEALEKWLRDAGYDSRRSWDGAIIAKIDAHPRQSKHSYLLPYLDGDVIRVDPHRGDFRIDPSGDFKCNDTEGGHTEPDRDEDGEQCSDCEEYYDRDDMTYVEYNDSCVCDCCLRANYTRVYHTQEYVPDDCVVTATDGYTWGDSNSAPDGYTPLDEGRYTGQYAPDEDTVTDRSGAVWHERDRRDGRLVQLCGESRMANEYAEKCDCTEHDGYGWMLDDEEPPQDETETETETEAAESLITGE